MMQNGLLSEQTMLEHGTKEKESGLFRTPDAHLGKRGAKSKEGYLDSLKNGTHAINLLDQVKHNYQPMNFPTPSANEDAAGTPKGKMQRMLGNCEEVRNSGKGTLNSEWVEWLMGYPIGWTDIGLENQKESQELQQDKQKESKDLKDLETL